MLRRLLLLLFLFPLPALSYWDGGWNFRTEATLTSDQARADYQVVLQISGNDLHADYNWSNNGNDLRVIAGNDSTQLNFYIRSWDQSSEQATIVVRFNNLMAGANNFYLYYGNSSAPSASDISSTRINGLSYSSRQSTIDPRDWNTAYAELNKPVSAGYGDTVITDLTGIENSDLPGGSNTNYVAYMSAQFVVPSARRYYFRLGSDFGRGGELRIDGKTIEAQWNDDLWWKNTWTNNHGDVLEGGRRLSAGEHTLEILGSEGSNDGGMTLQVRDCINNGFGCSNWRAFSTANFTIHVPVAEDNNSLDVRYGVSTKGGGRNLAIISNNPEYWTLNGTRLLSFTITNIGSDQITDVIKLQLNLGWNLAIESAFWGAGWDCENGETSNYATCTYRLPVNPGDTLPPIRLQVSAHNNNGNNNFASYGATVAYWNATDSDTSDNTVSETLPIVDHVLPAINADCAIPSPGVWASFYDVRSIVSGYISSRSQFERIVSQLPAAGGKLELNNIEYGGNDRRSGGTNGNPVEGMSDDHFMGVFHGYLKVTSAGLYRLGINGDDNVELRVDGQPDPLLGIYNGHSVDMDITSALVYMTAGYHEIEFWHYENDEAEGYYLLWQPYASGGNLRDSVAANADLFYCPPEADLHMSSSVTIVSDPVNGDEAPKAIPGAVAEITVKGVNKGVLTPDTDTISVTQIIPADSQLYVDGGVVFTDGVNGLASGLTLGNITYSTTDDSPASFNYSAEPDGEGYDSEIRYMRIEFDGDINPATDTVQPEFRYQYRVRLK